MFEQTCKPSKLRAVSERTISQFVKALRERRRSKEKIGLAPHTIKNYLIALKSALGWVVGQKLLPSLPTFPVVKVPKKKPQPIPAESFEKLLAKAPDEFWRAYLLCGWWGLRLSEALHLQWERNDELPWATSWRPPVDAQTSERLRLPGGAATWKGKCPDPAYAHAAFFHAGNYGLLRER